MPELFSAGGRVRRSAGGVRNGDGGARPGGVRRLIVVNSLSLIDQNDLAERCGRLI